MAEALSASKIVLLAVHYVSKADLDNLSTLTARYQTVLRKELLLRILLTYLPETLASDEYVPFLQEIETGEYAASATADLDLALIQSLTEEEAARQVRRLRLEQLTWNGALQEAQSDPLALFLFRRSYKVDEEAGLLDQLPALLTPFLARSAALRSWTISTVLSLLRRNYEYYPETPLSQTLAEFEALDDARAVGLMLERTGRDDAKHVARDLRGMLGPWIHSERRWKHRRKRDSRGPPDAQEGAEDLHCPGWESFLAWLNEKAASQDWKVAVHAISEWDGPADTDTEGYGRVWLQEDQQQHLERRYARAALAAGYSITETTPEALMGVYAIARKVSSHLDDAIPPLQSAASLLPPMEEIGSANIVSPKNVMYLRNELLEEANPLTKPTKMTTKLLSALALSAYFCTKMGWPMAVRRAGELALLKDQREQHTEAMKLIHAASNNGPRTDDKYWSRVRNEVLWLRNGGDDDSTSSEDGCFGIFCQLEVQFLEVEILTALLTNTRYELAKTIYLDPSDPPVPHQVLEETVYAAAMQAYDSASNPNRTRGGLKRCDDVLRALKPAFSPSSPLLKRAEALLKATHAFADYKVLMKQGEPLTPIVLRVHQDPLSIIGKLLEQNTGSYTNMQELVTTGLNLRKADLTTEDAATIERRIIAMCVEQALAEHDFETAYSYVANHIATLSQPTPAANGASAAHKAAVEPVSQSDDVSWRAALAAGKYKRNARTLKPTHLGTASGNIEIRHLNQRLECISTALRIAPADTLQEILNTYRRCEEELDAAVQAEAEQESAWDEAADQHMPGGFASNPAQLRNATISTGLKASSGSMRDEAPMSLFDLSRASVMSAQKNLTALSHLSMHQDRSATHDGAGDDFGSAEQQRIRKRDQLRDAAMGTLTSGVGWLIGAQPAGQGSNER